MRHTMIESLLGAFVLFVAAWFVFYGHKAIGSKSDGAQYIVVADFSTVGALKEGDPVRISGVKVGKIASIELDQKTYIAHVRISMGLQDNLPSDTSAAIMSESLMGGVYMAVSPGGADETIENGGRIAYTQSPQNLGELLGKFIFSSQGGNKGGTSNAL